MSSPVSENSEIISDHSESSVSEDDPYSNNFEIKDLIPRPWSSSTSAGTEEEIACFSSRPSRAALSLRISKKRKQFNQIIAKFSATESNQPSEIPQVKDNNFRSEFFLKTIDLGLQAGCGTPRPSGQSFQAKYFLTMNKSFMYDKQDLAEKYEKEAKMISDPTEVPALESFLRNVEVKMEEALQSNEIIDVFHDDFEVLGNDETEGSGNLANQLAEIRTLNNIEFTRTKQVSDVQWAPGEEDVVATCCIENITYQERVERAGVNIAGAIIFWTFAEFNNVRIVLKSPIEVMCFCFNPHRPHLVVGGTISGQVALWDTQLVTDKTRIEMLPKQHEAPELLPLVLSGIFESHKGPVKSLCWLPNQVRIERKQHCVVLTEPYEVSQIATLSEDGLILFWDTLFSADNKNPYKIYDYVWVPLLRVQLTRTDNRNDMGGSCLYIAPSQLDSSFWATNDSGDLVRGDWVARTMEEGRPEFVKKMYLSDVSYRSTVTLQVSPFMSDIILTVHDFQFNIWKEGCETPVYQSHFHSVYLTCGAWSPIRPAMLFIGRADGRIDIWDFLDQSMKESLFHTVSGQKLAVITFQLNKKHPQLVAVGDVVGNVHTYEVSRHSTKDTDREKKAIYEFWCKEEERVAYYEERFLVRAEEHHQDEMRKRALDMQK